MKLAPAWFERAPYIGGVILCGLAVLEVLVLTDAFDSNQSVALALSIGATIPLLFVRSHVIVVTGTVVATVFVLLVVYHWVPVATLLALFAALFTLGLRQARWMVLTAIASFVLYALAVVLGGSGEADVSEAVENGSREPPPVTADSTEDERLPLLVAAVAAAAAGLGAARKTRAVTVERDASRQVVAETLVENAALGERARIARELHDVVAHHISLISVQAETARLATPDMPPEGAERLQDIGETARTALAEMRRLLGVLREEVDVPPLRAPQPGLAQLVELVDEARQLSGASTRLVARGHVRAVDPGVGLTAYRIVQEALTNARRHAPGAAVDVELHYRDDSVRLRIRDNGPGPHVDMEEVRSSAGHGLLGMRERIVAAGGVLRLGEAPGGGFLVEAILPVGVTEHVPEAAEGTVE